MKCHLLITLILLLWLVNAQAVNGQSSTTREAYLFAYFKDNGQDGLHLAYSLDGYTWKALNKDKSLLTPVIGNARLMRDPYIIHAFRVPMAVLDSLIGISMSAVFDLPLNHAKCFS